MCRPVKELGMANLCHICYYKRMKYLTLRYRFFVVCIFCFLSSFLFSQQILQTPLVGTLDGLFRISGNSAEPIWTEGEVHKIIYSDRYYFLTSKGIMASDNLVEFTELNENLPVHTLKTYNGIEKSFSHTPKEIKDLSAHPQNPKIIVTATRDSVYISKNSGNTWRSLGLSAKTSGCKSIAVADMPIYNNKGLITGSELVVFMSHPIYGLSYILPDTNGSKWTDIESGFDTLPGNPYVDEIADILPVLVPQSDGSVITKIYLSQTFIPRMYELDWQKKKGNIIWRGELVNGTVDSLVYDNNTLYFLEMAGFSSFDLSTKNITKKPPIANYWLTLVNKTQKHPQCAFFTQKVGNKTIAVSLSEMWMLYPSEITSPYFSTIKDKKSIYIPSNQVEGEALEKNLKTIAENGLNSIVVDMKDDHGMLRFDAKTPSIIEKQGISRYAIALDPFVEKLKADNIYLIARIVVFKDKNLYQYGGGKYAVWDTNLKKPWLGIRNYTDILDEEGVKTGTQTNYYDEYWVDPYSEEVWAYNIAIAQELIERGFDEIQFDYIRFPTDGYNLDDTNFRWQDNSMDKESALISFLSYARENLKAPIGIDIYGANGWYRSGARTGQDVEMLSHFVDVISPMFYPNHFEQNFLDYAPAAERPYRIHYFGGYRNSLLARNKVLIRPWVQAFYMNVSYDRVYYGKDYVQREIFGVRDSLNMGYMYWNNVGRYDDIRPDVKADEPYPWTY